MVNMKTIAGYSLTLLFIILTIFAAYDRRDNPQRYIHSEEDTDSTIVVLKGWLPHVTGDVIVNHSGSQRYWDEKDVVKVVKVTPASDAFKLAMNILYGVLIVMIIICAWLGYKRWKELPEDHWFKKALDKIGDIANDRKD